MAERQIEIGYVRSVRPGNRELRITPVAGLEAALEHAAWLTVVTRDGAENRCRIAAVRAHGLERLVALTPGVTRDAVARMRGAAIWIGESECEAAEAAYALADLQDLEVQDTEGRRIGKVADVYATGAHGVIEIATGGGMTLSVPVIEPVIASVDLEQGVIVVNDIAPYAVESAGEPAQPEGA